MKNFIKRLFCHHNYVFYRNIYGDEIIACGWKRSINRCTKCGKFKWLDKLQTGECKMVKRTHEFEPNQKSQEREEMKEMHGRGYTSSDQDLMNKPCTGGTSIQSQFKTVEEKPNNVKRFELLNAECALMYARKNKDYGDSFNTSLDEDGLIVGKIRLGDKYSRYCQLIKNPAEVKEEKLRDTLLDLANYAKMLVMWLDENPQATEIPAHYFEDKPLVMQPGWSYLGSGQSYLGASPFLLAGADFDGDYVKEMSKSEDTSPYPTCGDEVVKPSHGIQVLDDKNVFNITVNAAPDMDAKRVARTIVDEIKRAR